MNAGPSNVPSNRLKISDKKILVIRNPVDYEELYDEVQILHIENQNEDEILEILRNLNFDDFSNVFIFTFANLKITPEITALLSHNIDDREFFLHAKFCYDFQAFHKPKNSKKFELVESNNEDYIRLVQAKIPAEIKNINHFFMILRTQNSLLCEVDFCSISNLNPTKDKFSLLTKAIKDEKESLVKLLALFVDQENEKIVESALETENCNIIVAILKNVSSKYIVSLSQKSDEIKQKILTIIIETGNQKLLNNFQQFREHFPLDLQKKIKIAQERNLSKHVESFKFSLEIPKKRRKIEDEREIENFHMNICDGNLQKVRNFVKKNPNEKVCYNSHEVSALEAAIENEKFEIYSFLQSEGFICNKLDEIIENLSELEKKTIENFNLMFFKECPEKVVNLLASKCEFFVTANKLSSSETREALENVRKIEGAEEMMKILAQSDVKFKVDMNNKNICKIAPIRDKNTKGLSVKGKGLIQVAKAKNKIDREATFAHEMTHYVCDLIYENTALPYSKYDTEKEAEFEVIFQEVKSIYENDKQGIDKIIASIFELYAVEDPLDPEKVEKAIIRQKCELIARVPDLLTSYRYDSNKLNSLKIQFSSLFHFYYTKFLCDLRIENIYEMTKLNNDFGLLDSIEKSKWQANSKQDFEIPNNDQKRILVVSKTPQLFLSRLVQKLKQILVQRSNKQSQEQNNFVSAQSFKAKNIFIDPKKINFYAEKLKSLITSSNCEKIVSKADEILIKFVDKVQYILVADESDSNNIANLTKKFGFVRQDINFGWKDLSEYTQNWLQNKKVNFQGHQFKIRELFDEPQKSITSDVLKVLLENEDIFINCDLNKENWDNFILRTIKQKSKIPNSTNSNETFEFLEVSTTDFILNSRKAENFQNIVLISDLAGSGKTFLFKKLCDELKNARNEIQMQQCESKNETRLQNCKDQKNLIFALFLPLKSHLEELKEFNEDGKDDAQDKFVNFVAKMSKLDALTKAVFAQKFSNGETMIFFDGFDEISPSCKTKTEKLFDLFQISLEEPKDSLKERKIERQLIQNEEMMEIERNEESTQEQNIMEKSSAMILKSQDIKSAIQKKRNQILISTRTHLEADLEKKFRVLSNKIKNLSTDQQVQFLKNVWLKPDSDQKLIENCAKKLVQKITELMRSMSSAIGVPIILCGLAEFFDEKIKEGTEVEIQGLNISEVYHKITVDKPLEIFEGRHLEKAIGKSGNSRKLKNSTEIHQYFAIKDRLGVKMATSLGLTHNKRNWPLEEIARYGIATYKNENDIIFNHQTYAEYLITLILFELLETVDDFSEPQKEFLIRIFTEEKLKISRMFLDSMLENVEKYEELEFLNSSTQLCELLREKQKFLDLSCEEGLFCIFDSLVSSILTTDEQLFRDLVEGYYKTEQNESINFYSRGKLLAFAKNLEKVGKFLDNIQEANVDFSNYLTKTDRGGLNTLHFVAWGSKSHKIFEVFWSKCETFLKNEEEIKQIFTQKDKVWSRNLFQISLKNENDPKMFQTIFNLLWTKIFNGNLEEIDEFLSEQDQSGDNVIITAAKFGCADNLKFLFKKIEEIFGSFKVIECLRVKNREGENLLNLAVVNNSKDSKEVLLQILDEKLSPEEICQMKLDEKHARVDNIFHQFAIKCLKPTANFNILIQKMEEKFKNEDETRKVLFERNKMGRNALIVAASRWNSEEIFPLFFNEIYCKFFQKIEHFIYEIDETWGNNFLHTLAQYWSAKVLILKFALEKLKEMLVKVEFAKYLEMKNKFGENCFHLMGGDEDKFQFLTAFVKNEFNKEKLQKMLSEKDNKKSIPLHSPFEWNQVGFYSDRFEYFPYFISIYEQNFTDNEIEKFLKQKTTIFYEEALTKELKKAQDYPESSYLTEEVEKVEKILAKYNLNLILSYPSSPTSSSDLPCSCTQTSSP